MHNSDDDNNNNKNIRLPNVFFFEHLATIIFINDDSGGLSQFL